MMAQLALNHLAHALTLFAPHVYLLFLNIRVIGSPHNLNICYAILHLLSECLVEHLPFHKCDHFRFNLIFNLNLLAFKRQALNHLRALQRMHSLKLLRY